MRVFSTQTVGAGRCDDKNDDNKAPNFGNQTAIMVSSGIGLGIVKHKHENNIKATFVRFPDYHLKNDKMAVNRKNCLTHVMSFYMERPMVKGSLVSPCIKDFPRFLVLP